MSSTTMCKVAARMLAVAAVLAVLPSWCAAQCFEQIPGFEGWGPAQVFTSGGEDSVLVALDVNRVSHISTDRGATWDSLQGYSPGYNTARRIASVRPLPDDPTTIRVFNSKESWISRDWGRTWTLELKLGTIGPFDYVSDPQIHRHPRASELILVVHRNDFTMRSTDNGATWHKTMFAPQMPCRVLAFVDEDPASLIAVAGDSVLSSSDSGASFSYLHPLGTFNGSPVHGIVLDRAVPSRWYGTLPLDGVVVSTDQGKSWQRREGSSISFAEYILQSTVNADVIWAVGSNAISLSTDNGETWTRLVHQARNHTLASFALKGNDLVYSYRGVLYQRSPQSTEPMRLAKQIDQRRVDALAIGAGGVMIAASYGQVFFRDAGSNLWRQVLEKEFERDSIVGDVQVVADPYAPGLFFVYSGARYYWTSNGGLTWQHGVAAGSIHCILFTNETILMFAGSEGYISDKNTLSFRLNSSMSHGLTMGAVSPTASRYVVAMGTTESYGSSDYGTTWFSIGKHNTPDQVIADPIEDGVFHAFDQYALLLSVKDRSVTRFDERTNHVRNATFYRKDSSIYRVRPANKVVRYSTKTRVTFEVCTEEEFESQVSSPALISFGDEIYAWGPAGLHRYVGVSTTSVHYPAHPLVHRTVRPSPAFEHIYLETTESPLDTDKLVVVNAQGYQYAVTILDRTTGLVDISSLSPGVYLATYMCGNRLNAVSFVKIGE